MLIVSQNLNQTLGTKFRSSLMEAKGMNMGRGENILGGLNLKLIDNTMTNEDLCLKNRTDKSDNILIGFKTF